MGEALDLGVGAEEDDARHVDGVEEVLGLARAEVVGLGGIDEEHLAAALGRLALVQDADGHGDTGAVEEVGRQPDDRLEQVGLDDALADGPLGTAAEEDPVRHHHAHRPLGVRDGEHVLEEGEVALGPGRDGAVAVEAVMGVVGGEVAPPLLQEGGIGDS